jgi:hypothetical protein
VAQMDNVQCSPGQYLSTETYREVEMKKLLAALVMLSLMGCGSVSLKTPDGLEFQSRTLWKDIESVSFQGEEFVGELGSSKSAQDARAILLVCLLLPDTPGCQSE